MATWAHHKEFADFAKLLSAIEDGGVWIHRPLSIHDVNTTGKKCHCCDSHFAIEVERRDFVDVLIDPATGVRKVRQHVKDKAEWDRLAAKAKRIVLPHRVSRAQLRAMECDSKVLAIFGGVRGGKTSFIADIILTQSLLYGGSGVQIWWVSPTLEKTTIGLRKLVEGETIGKGKTRREVAPLIPPELIRYVPSSHRSDRLYIELIDGTRIYFKYASRDGGNLKGDPPLFAVLDEGCEVDKKENYQQLLDRLMEADGRLLIATTPVAGHFLKEVVYDAGVNIKTWTPDDRIAWTHITCFENPWVNKRMIQETIEAINDPQRVRREIYGEWVGSGPLLWRHFDEQDHIISSDAREPSELGLVDITAAATRRFYRGAEHDRHCGQDFNLHPMGLVELRVAYHPDDPRRTPILMVTEEVIEKVGTIYQFIDTLHKRGYTGVGIACDATGAQLNSYRMAHGIKDRNSTQQHEMVRHGFDCQPCHWSDSGNPTNPPQLDRLNLLHRLMRERIDLGNGRTFPRFLIHPRCKKTLIALRVQESDDRGNVLKEAGTESDRISSPTDALAYGAWAVAPIRSEHERSTVIKL